MDGILKKVVMSAACAASIFIGGNKLHAYASNLAQSQDVQRQIKLSHESVLSNAYELDGQKNAEGNKGPIVFGRILGYDANLEKGGVKKDHSLNGGFLVGAEKAINANWTIGSFTGFQYADCKFKDDYLVGVEDLAKEYVYEVQAIRESYSMENGEHIYYHEVADTKCQTKSFISGLYGRYEKDKLLVQVAGTFGLHHYKQDGTGTEELRNSGGKRVSQPIGFKADHYGWSLGLSGRAAYDLSRTEGLKFGPLLGLDGSYINNNEHCETAYLPMQQSIAQQQNICFEMNKHIVKSLKSFVGIFVSKQFKEISCPTMAYAEIGWACECMRSGRKSTWETNRVFGEGSSPYHMHPEYGYWEYLPRNTFDGKIGLKTLLTGSLYGGVALGLSCGSHYHDISGELSVEMVF